MNRYSRLRSKRLLDLDKPLYSRRRMTTRGHSFGMGELIPWKELGFSRLTMERWFRLRMISHHPGGDQHPDLEVTQDQIDQREGRTDGHGRRLGGPIFEEFVEAGYDAEDYPPEGWAPRESPGYTAYLEALTAPE